MSERNPCSDAECILRFLLRSEAGYHEGWLNIKPDELDPLLACDAAVVVPDLVMTDEFGWSIHVSGGVIRHDRTWCDRNFEHMDYEDFAFYSDCLDAYRELS
jgi:hypothetical protein